ncbi:hypothetical protein FQA39_LY17314 [Lamprigera yunnana]|nr:hypothetical protein FQA39_LY17314 [Lamprigera yunnana]
MLGLSRSSDLDEEQDSVSVTTSDTDSERNEVIQSYNEQQPTFGNIKVENSTDIHFGNKTYYQGPVTVKQILYAKPELPIVGENKDCDIVYNGNDNKCFVLHNDEIKLKTDNKDNVQDTNPSTTKGLSGIQNFSHQHLLVVISLAAVLLVSLVTLLTVLSTRSESPNMFSLDSNEQDKGTPSEYPVDASVNLTLPGKLKIISRKEWLAQPPSQSINRLVLPIPYVIISHTATENCTNQAECTFYIRYLQTYHIESKNYWDITYNFLVGGDGYAYEGRGWKYEGAHTFDYNSRSIGIAFIGTFNGILPPPRQILAAKQLIQMGTKYGYIRQNYELYGEKQLQDAQSPGTVLFEEIKSWPRWNNKKLRL